MSRGRITASHRPFLRLEHLGSRASVVVVVQRKAHSLLSADSAIAVDIRAQKQGRAACTQREPRGALEVRGQSVGRNGRFRNPSQKLAGLRMRGRQAKQRE